MTAATSLAATLLYPAREIEVRGFALHLEPGIFPPDLFPSTGLLLDWALANVQPRSRILEIGTGCGAIAIALAMRLDVVGVACDLSRLAVDNARSNVRRHSLEQSIAVVESDVFSGLALDESPFDVILWNSPFMSAAPGSTCDEFHDPGYGALTDFFSRLSDFLSPGGHAYLGFGSIGNLALLKEKAAQFDWSLRERASFAIHEPAGSFDYLVLEVVAHGPNA